MPERRSIAVVEPQMHNLFHSPFNAALLHAVVLQFPDANISFSAVAGHTDAVRGILEEHAPEILARVEWRALESPPSQSVLSRWVTNRRILRRVLGWNERVVFCSISRMQLLQLKRMMKRQEDVLAVLHGDLERIAELETERFPASLFALKKVLLMAQPPSLRYILLSESIRQHLPVEFSAAFKDAVVMDHPYHFPAQQSAALSGAVEPVVFGIFGNCGDGRLLEQVARATKTVNPRIVFRLVGFVADREAKARLGDLVDGVGDTPISRAEFVRRAESITYAIWLAPPGSFRLRASGTFFDALAYTKPLVYVANAFLDPYLHSAAFAFRCADIEDVAPALLWIAERHLAAEYTLAQTAMREFRERFAPETLAGSLPEKFGW